MWLRLNKKQAKERIEELRKKTEYYAKKYYDDDKPEISDFEYDMLMVELRNLEKEFPEYQSKESLTQKVGGHVKEGFTKVTHEVPLQSLQDVFSIEEVEDYIKKIKFCLVIEILYGIIAIRWWRWDYLVRLKIFLVNKKK